MRRRSSSDKEERKSRDGAAKHVAQVSELSSEGSSSSLRRFAEDF